MKKILLIALIAVLASAFTFTKGSGNIVEDEQIIQDKFLAANCSQNRVNAVYSAITFCEIESQDTTTKCIQNTLFNKTNERWDVYTKAKTSRSGVSYWYYSNCSLVLNGYGRYNRTYMIWSSQPYSNSSKSQSISSVLPAGNCSSARVNVVTTALNSCQTSDQTAEAQCIQNRIKANLTEYWDSFVSSDRSSSVQYWYYDDCSLNFTNFGRYNRTYEVWKAQ